jgi:hypothetical protein
MIPVPTEAVEQRLFVQYLRLKGYKHFRVPSETFTKSWNQKRVNRDLGVVKGVPDLFVIVKNRLIAVEMKRTKGSVTSPEQVEWIKALNDAGVIARICKGVEEAIKFVEEMEE